MKKIIALALLTTVAATGPALANKEKNMDKGFRMEDQSYFNRMDNNRDNVLSKAEYEAYAYGANSFDVADVNNDNVLTQQEFANYKHQWLSQEAVEQNKLYGFVPGNNKAARYN